MSALNEEAPAKAVVFGRRRRKVRCEIDQIKQQGQQGTSNINNLQGKTYCLAGSSHLTRPTG